MSSALFLNWLQLCNNYISQSPNRMVILLIDKCGAHGSHSTSPQMSNVRVEFLPPNTTFRMQHLDAGIIAAFQIRYRAFQMERALDLFD